MSRRVVCLLLDELISVVKCLAKSDVNNADSKREWSAIGGELMMDDFNAAHLSS